MPEALDEVALAQLVEMVGDDAEFVDELVDTYLAESPLQVAAIRAALGAGSADDIVRPAHTLKSSSQNLGATQVADIARAIEERGRAGGLDGVEGLLADLDTATVALESELARARERRWSSA